MVWLLVAGCALGASTFGRPTFADVDESSKRLHTNYFASPRIFAAAATTRPENRTIRRRVRPVGGDGSVYFHDARTGLSPFDNPGWIYAPHGLAEATLKRTASRNIGDGWYTFPNLVVDDY
ncbi:hypothetical protein GS461_21825 [Rhodococcus hoagii]|nr:hypothetical protein [Prescottella equi]